jgi:nanoRNase/pAp phosphatase (c-di-AMP/oligoRNAs hydrolase)
MAQIVIQWLLGTVLFNRRKNKMKQPQETMKQQERSDAFRAFVEKAHGNFLIIVAQVDPDAIASAMGLAAIIRHLKEGSCHIRIAYAGKVGHPQNRALINKYNLSREMTPVSEIKMDEKTVIALVDSSSLDDARLPEDIRRREPDIVIDHHRDDARESTEHFRWVEEVGAASTLIVQLAQHLGVEMIGHLSMLLALGIYIDTKKLIAASPADRAAYGAMADLVSPHELMQLVNYSLSESYFENLEYALSHRTRSGGRVVVNAGAVKSEDGDDLSIIADEVLRCEGTVLVVVWGMFVRERRVRISARSSDPGIDLKQFLQERFGAASAGAKFTPDGRGEGGALVSFDLGVWMSEGVIAQAEALVDARIKELALGD